MQKQALLWCIDRENPVLPKSETDHPVQFWQLKKTDGKVSNVLFFQPYAYSHTLRRLTISIVCRTSLHYPSPLTFIRSCYENPTTGTTTAWQRRVMRRQHGLVRT